MKDAEFGPLTLEIAYISYYPKFMGLFERAVMVRHDTWSIGDVRGSTWRETVVSAVEAGLLPFTGPDTVREWYGAMPLHWREHVNIYPMMTVQGRPRLVPAHERDRIQAGWFPRIFDDRPGADYDAWSRAIEADREWMQARLAAAADEYEAHIIRTQYMGWLA